jgi:hypothetical protein
MSSYNWCHNPDCHTIETQSRVRGTGDNKVLRTRKIPLTSEYIRNSIYAYFCNQNCLHQFLNKFAREVANIRAVRQPSETPIKVEKEKYESYRYDWNSDDNGGTRRVPYMATRTIIKNSS